MDKDEKRTGSQLKIKMGGGNTARSIPAAKPAENAAESRVKKPSGAGMRRERGIDPAPSEPAVAIPPDAYYPRHTLSPYISETIKTGDIEIEGANVISGPVKFDWISIVFQPLGALLAVVLLLIILNATGNGNMGSMYLLIGGVTGVLGILWGVIRYNSQKKQAAGDKEANEQKYRAYLRDKEKEITDSVSDQLRIMRTEAPSAAECVQMDEHTPALWRRPFNSSSFMLMCLGVGSVRFSRQIKTPEKRYADDNALTDEARLLAEQYRIIENAPIICDFKSKPTLGIVGERKAVTDQAIALLANAAALHSYEDLKIVLLYPGAERALWESCRFLPHVFDDDWEQRYMADNQDDAKALLDDIAKVVERRRTAKSEYGFSQEKDSHPHYLIVVADMSYLAGTSYGKMLFENNSSIGISCIFLASNQNNLPQQCNSIVELSSDGGKLFDTAAGNEEIRFIPERISNEQWKLFAERIAPVRLENPTSAKGLPKALTFFDAYGIKQPEDLDLKNRWEQARPEQSMNVRLGGGLGGNPVGFDIHPNRSGAHGIIVGGTSSGKTTMIRAWVLSMAASFSPEYVSFVLIDFKQPGLLNGLEDLPHVVGTLGKLDLDIERNLTALRSEISRRQKVFEAAKTINIYDYLTKHRAGKAEAQAPMPFLYIVVDELKELKTWSKDNSGSEWMDLLDQLYTTGSALGVHIVAASQTPEPFTSVMVSNSRFRWCLRTNEANDSREVLGNTKASEIKIRGRGFIRVGNSIEELQPIYADGPYFTQQELRAIPEREMALVSLKGARWPKETETGAKLSQLETVVRYISDYVKTSEIRCPAKIWPDRLPTTITYDSLAKPSKNALSAVVGLVDDPPAQSQYPLEISLSNAKTGAFMVYGAGQTGKTTFLQTFVYSLLENNSPEQMEVYIVESSMGDFDGFDAFPHVKQISDSYSASEIINTVDEVLKKRKKTKKDPNAKRILLVVDNINAVITDCNQEISNIIRTGPGHGIHLVASATPVLGSGSVLSIETLFKTGFSFWISESSYEYAGPIHDKSVKSVPPTEIVGRGITSLGHVVNYQTALLKTPADPMPLSDYLKERAEALWGNVQRDDLPRKEELPEGTVVLGRKTGSITPVQQNFWRSASLLIIGDDYEERQKVMKSVLGQLLLKTKPYAIIGVDLDQDSWSDVDAMTFLVSGSAMDEYLLGMHEELVIRHKASTSAPPYIFLVDSLPECMEHISELSANKVDKNLLRNASVYSVFFIASCSYEEFEREYEKEESLVAKSNEDGKEIVPLTRAASGKCLLLDADPDMLHPFFRDRYSFEGRANYYLDAGEAKPIDIE